jgi:hypothetical protein
VKQGVALDSQNSAAYVLLADVHNAQGSVEKAKADLQLYKFSVNLGNRDSTPRWFRSRSLDPPSGASRAMASLAALLALISCS